MLFGDDDMIDDGNAHHIAGRFQTLGHFAILAAGVGWSLWKTRTPSIVDAEAPR